MKQQEGSNPRKRHRASHISQNFSRIQVWATQKIAQSALFLVGCIVKSCGTPSGPLLLTALIGRNAACYAFLWRYNRVDSISQAESAKTSTVLLLGRYDFIRCWQLARIYRLSYSLLGFIIMLKRRNLNRQPFEPLILASFVCRFTLKIRPPFANFTTIHNFHPTSKNHYTEL